VLKQGGRRAVQEGGADREVHSNPTDCATLGAGDECLLT